MTGMDFRLPGSVSVEMLEFTPQPGGEPVTGAVVGTTDIAEGGQAEVQTEEAEVEDPQNMAPPKETPPGAGGSGSATATDSVQ